MTFEVLIEELTLLTLPSFRDIKLEVLLLEKASGISQAYHVEQNLTKNNVVLCIVYRIINLYMEGVGDWLITNLR